MTPRRGTMRALVTHALAWAFRTLCWLYPPAFRRRFGEEMRTDLRASMGEAPGLVGLLATWARAAGEVPSTATREWGAALRGARPRSFGGATSLGTELVADARHAVRSYLRAPVLAAASILALALGLGGNAALFSVVDAVLLRPLPYVHPERLVSVWPGTGYSKAKLEALHESLAGTVAVAGYRGLFHQLVVDGSADEIVVNECSWDYLQLLGTTPALGRAFGPRDQDPGAERVVILGHALWVEHFGADPDVIGRRIELEGRGADYRTVVGVMPESFRPLREGASAWAPMVADRSAAAWTDEGYLDIVGRLGPGVTAQAAQAAMQVAAARLRELFPREYTEQALRRARLVPLHDELVGPTRGPLVAVMAAVLVVLLLTCVNVAALLVARGNARTHEFGVRVALGAGRGRLVRQLLTESLVLWTAGGLCGLALARVALGAWVDRLPEQIPHLGEIGVDGTVVAATLAVTIVSGALFGLLPALRAAGVDARGRGGGRALAPSLRGATGSRTEHRLSAVLVGVEVALSVALVGIASLLGKSTARLLAVDPGFDPEGVVAARVAPAPDRYASGDERIDYYRRVAAAVAARPGVGGVGMIHRLPLDGGNTTASFTLDGIRLERGQTFDAANYRVVTSSYFGVMGIPLRAGRLLGEQDAAGTEPAAVVNEAFVRRFLPEGDAVGHRITGDEGEPWLTVVGVVGDVRQHALAVAVKPEIYVPFAQDPHGAMYLVVRRDAAARDPTTLLRSVREAVLAVDPQTPVTSLRTYEQLVHASTASTRFVLALFAAFATLALLLAVLGVYGVTSHATSRRSREIGVRMVLGADRGEVLAATIARGMRPVLPGVAVGLALAVAGAYALRTLLYQVAPTDPTVLAAVALALVAVAAVACWLPARRAGRLDPVEVLRGEG